MTLVYYSTISPEVQGTSGHAGFVVSTAGSMLAPMPMATSPTFDRILASIILSQDRQGLRLGFRVSG